MLSRRCGLGSTLVEYDFVEEEEYVVRVNVSNTISSSEKQLSVNIIQRIENVLLSKLDPPPYAVATNDDQGARINVSIVICLCLMSPYSSVDYVMLLNL